ncbi:hypothetical protein [Dissulfuribacter thermophilus]|nr:hypothetical protein [Dissulfuribacter thermophilus]
MQKRYALIIAIITLFHVFGLQCSNAQDFAKSGIETLLKGKVVSLNFSDKYMEIKSELNGDIYKVFVDDPARLRRIRVGTPIRVVAEKSFVSAGTFMAREIMIAGARCRCDPTGVRSRLQRAMRGRSFGGGWHGHSGHR